MSKPRIDDIEAAILQAIKDEAALAYIPDDQVQTLGERSLDFERQQIVVVPPAVLVFYTGGSHQPLEGTLTLYRHRPRFALIAVAENLRGPGEARRGGPGSEKGAYDILDDLRSLFAGKELTGASFTGVKPICTLGEVRFEGFQPGMAAYSLELEVDSHWDKV